MDFGRVTTEDLSALDLSLPADHPATNSILTKKAASIRVYTGCAKWGRKDWIGTIYPKGTKEADFLKFYGRHFNAIELNATFYKLPSKKQTESWAAKVGDDFRFCPKFSDKITHLKRLNDVGEYTDRFIEGISGFGKKLGTCLLMLHPGMAPKTIDRIQTFLQSLPKDLKVSIEFRHPDWFSQQENFDSIFETLQKNGTSAAITDAAGRRDCVHMRLTTSEAFIRFVGNGLHPTDYTRIDEWVERLSKWMNEGLETLYFFMHQPEEVHSPQLCRYFIRQLNKKTGMQIHDPEFIQDTVS
jgi:uncharacterized protein YecE (DUF72 family)